MNVTYILLGIIIVLLIFIIIKLWKLLQYAYTTWGNTKSSLQALEEINNAVHKVNDEILSIKDKVTDIEDEIKDLGPDYSPETLERIKKQRQEP